MPDYKKAQEEAEKVWKKLCLSSPPVPILEVCASYSLTVIGVSFQEQPDVSGILDIEKRIIYLDHSDTPEHKRFTIAHELGHWLLHREALNGDPNLSIYYRRPIGGELNQKEKEANCFAANLLVPTKFLAELQTSYSETELASIFAVSRQVIGYRKKYLVKASENG